jgi:hypothetical protein
MMNSPEDGTLSSYGYILSVIFFLQQTRYSLQPRGTNQQHQLQHAPQPQQPQVRVIKPILPNLQIIPPDWDGSIPPYELAKQLDSISTRLPRVYERIGTTDSESATSANVYFLQPNPIQLQHLQVFQN